MTLHATDVATALQQLRDTNEVVDALYRFAAGQDLKDAALFRSAFALHATLDFTHPAHRFGVDIPLMDGLEAIERILETLRPLVTSHTVTNPRVTIDADRATLSALVEAHHVMNTDRGRWLLLKNTYDLALVRDGERFVIEAMVIRNLWHEGDPEVLFGASPELGVVHIRSGEVTWIDQGGGVRLAPLHTGPAGAGTALLTFDAGGRSPAHRHPGGEALYVISGRLRVSDRVLEAGDFLHTPPRGVHDAEAEAPTVVLLTVPEPIEPVELP